jgi:hypothetical protein
MGLRSLLLPCCLLLTAWSGCSRRQLAVVEGRLPGDAFHGEPVYLVPVKNATAETVDSACILRDAFRFERRLSGREKESIYILRTRPLLRLKLQELLIVLEPGRLQVRLDSISSAHGTALNDSLQQWKEKKHRYDAILQHLHERLKTASAPQKDSLLALKAQVDSAYGRYARQFIRRNRTNVAGRFVHELTAPQ